MSVAFDHRDPGTAEAEWLAAAPWKAAPELVIAGERLIVLAAHPDDETLGAGGLVAVACAAGTDVTVVIATDGEGSHPATAPAEVARMRRLESTQALADLAPTAGLRFLGMPDGGLREHVDAVSTAVERELGPSPEGVLLVAPWWGDGHRDHRILGEIALRLQRPGVRVVGYPIWLWHWGRPDAVDTAHWRSLTLPDWARAAKKRAVGRHQSQTLPATSHPGDAAILHESMAAHFSRDVEVFIASDRAADQSVAVADFERRYARRDDPWGYETRWYEQRKRDLLLATLPRRRFAHALELGCATGLLTAQLAKRADRVVAVDAVASALAHASARVAGTAVVFEQRVLPADWPSGRFDLIVLSELGYYWAVDDLIRARELIAASLTDDGVVVACHWRHPISDAPLTGDQVHALLARSAQWERAVHHIEADLVLDVFTRPGAQSIAAAEGLA
ncbi:PIG-L family deacetylase [Microbacterium fluvii]|uniref:PIG-L family deacetylase n=1 Tax=Microbacterium fluvii TaxID=415215 RepID=A0ABW2H8F5_9MICO|nr:bifunctional PIG-L family deacetylase/class I SAM-dependent methyltransferase [Microbacterium fluvii]MCU4670997.1 PIG-L family deacetylase [Microbacterium fluvii]